MSKIQEIIERIAIYAEQNNFTSCLSNWKERDYFFSRRRGCKKLLEELNLDQIKEILCRVRRDVKPQLNFEEISEVIKDYPFQLPLEIYELYSKGNGCLPIGLNTIHSEAKNNYLNYFDFPGRDEIGFKPLNQCMDFYNTLVEFKEEYQTTFDLHWFPVAFFEDLIIAVVGSETQQATSPIISFYGEDLDIGIEIKPTILWSSVTNMLSAWIEVRERELHKPIQYNESEIEAICKKYGAGYPNRALYVP